MPGKPQISVHTTTLWDYPSQHYGREQQGDKDYSGVTPSHVIWNLLKRYTKEKDLVIDPMCGSGTTIDVARDLGRRALGYDLSPTREDIFRADARKLPLETEKADFVFIDPPYSTHIHYSDDPQCIGNLDALDPEYYRSMERVITEIYRVLRPGKFMALYCSDSFRLRKPFCPIGFRLFSLLERRFTPVDIVAVVRYNRTLKRNHYHSEAERGNYMLRGFNYLFIMQKEERRPVKPQALPKPSREFAPQRPDAAREARHFSKESRPSERDRRGTGAGRPGPKRPPRNAGPRRKP